MPSAGINVIGYVGANLGLGVAARQVVRMALARDIPVAIHNLDAGLGRDRTDRTFEALYVAEMSALPHAINLFIVGLEYVEESLARMRHACPADTRLNAVLCFWELAILPHAWIHSLACADAVVGVSEFMAHAYAAVLSNTPVVPGRLPVWLPPVASHDLEQYGVPSGATTFVSSLELHSDPARKNPMGVIDAFLHGVGDRPDAHLLLRVNNALDAQGRAHPFMAPLTARVADHPRVRVLTAPMTYPEVLGLYGACDVYVSLHRSEGLGLGIAEAMTLGRAVIATGWSGNMTFMNHLNSCPVGYELVRVRSETKAYRQDGLNRAVWAEPNLAEAGAYMRLLLEDPERRRRLGSAAQARMREFNAFASQGLFIDELLSIHAARNVHGVRGVQRPVPVLRSDRKADAPHVRVRRKIRRVLRRIGSG